MHPPSELLFFHYDVVTNDNGTIFHDEASNSGREEWVCPSEDYSYDSSSHSCKPGTGPLASKNLGPASPPGLSADGDSCETARPTAGNPIDVATGNKFQVETDYRSAGPAPLEFTRYYNSNRTGLQQTAIGAHWRTTFDRSVVLYESTTLTTAAVHRPDGKVFYFNAASGAWTADPDVLDTLERLMDSQGDPIGWRYTTTDDLIETYDANGRLESIADRRGFTWTLSYQSGRLASVAAPFGRSLSFDYYPNGRLREMAAPGAQVFAYTHDGDGNLSSVTYPDSSQKTYLYSESAHSSSGSPHELTGVIDQNGNRHATYAYDSQGRAVLSEHAGGAERATVAYTASRKVTNALGHDKFYAFSYPHGSARVTSATGGRTTTCSTPAQSIYDTDGFPTETVDFNGVRTTYVHNPRGREVSRTEAAGTANALTVTTDWHASFNLPSAIHEPGRSTAFSYDASGQLLSRSVTDTGSGEVRTTSYAYTSSLLTSIDGPRTDVADVWALGYDASGNLSSIQNPLGHLASIPDYDAHGRPLRIVDPNGVETRFTRDYRGRILSIDTAGAQWSYVYDLAGNLVSVTDPIGAQLTLTYDAAHQLIEVTDSLSNSVEYTLDAAGNRTLERYLDASGVLRTRRERVFAPQGWLAEVKGNGGQSTLYARDDEGHVVRETVAGQFVTDFAVDEFGRVVRTTDAEQGVSEQSYDPLGRLVRFTDPRGVVTEYHHNAFDDVVELRSPDGGTWDYTYDSAGNLTSEMDARGVVAAHSYDALGRRITTGFTDPVGGPAFQRDMRKYFYDQGSAQIGRLTRLESHGTHYFYSYDVWGNLVSEFSRIYGGGETDVSIVGYRYDLAGNLEGIVHDDGTDVEYTLDALGRPIGVDVQRGAVSTQLASAIEYLPFGPIRDLVLGNGIAVQRDFDLDGRVIAQSDGTVRDVTYAHDTRNNVSEMLDLLDSSRSESYTYDGLSRLTQTMRDTSLWLFGYDAAGNRTLKVAEAGAQSAAETYGYASGSNRLSLVAGTRAQSITHDENGNTVDDGTMAIDFDRANRAVSFGPSLVPLPTLTRQYNALGQRVAETRLPETPLAIKTHYRYDRQGNLIAERVGGVQTRTYVYLEGRPLATWSVPSDPVSTIPELIPEPALYYYHTDHLGTPRLMTDAAGAIAWDADYAPFGEANVRTEEVVNHLRFPGQYHSPETGLHYNWFRDYDPRSGRYIESDPIGLLGGVNLFAYALGNPVRWSDPRGLDTGADEVRRAVAGLESSLRGQIDATLSLAEGIANLADPISAAAATSDVGDAVAARLLDLAQALSGRGTGALSGLETLIESALESNEGAAALEDLIERLRREAQELYEECLGSGE